MEHSCRQHASATITLCNTAVTNKHLPSQHCRTLLSPTRICHHNIAQHSYHHQASAIITLCNTPVTNTPLPSQHSATLLSPTRICQSGRYPFLEDAGAIVFDAPKSSFKTKYCISQHNGYSKNKETVDLSLIPLICSFSILTVLDAFAMNSKGISSANKKKTQTKIFSASCFVNGANTLYGYSSATAVCDMHSVHRLHMVSVHIDHHRRLPFRTLNKLSHCLSVRPLVMSIRSVFVDTGHPERIALLREDIFDFVSS